MLEKLLEQIADKVVGLDEESLAQLLPKYKQQMENFESTREWERSVIIYFLINAVRVKNSIFNDNVQKGRTGSDKPAKSPKDHRDSPLKLIK